MKFSCHKRVRCRNGRRQKHHVTTKAHGTLTTRKAQALRLHRSIAEMIALDDQPFSIVTNKGFRQLLQHAEPRYTLPSEEYLKQTAVPDLYKSLHEKVAELIRDVHFVSFTTDAWTTSVSSESLISWTGHWIDDSWTRHSAILQTSHMPGSHTAENIKNKFEEMLTSFSLEQKVCVQSSIMVTD